MHPDLDQVRVLGKKADANRPVVVKFADLKDKEKLFYKTVDLLPGVKVEDQCIRKELDLDMKFWSIKFSWIKKIMAVPIFSGGKNQKSFSHITYICSLKILTATPNGA